MKQVVIALLWCAVLQAQSILITSPASNQVLSGFNGFPLSVSMTGLASATRVCYQVDGYPASQQGQNAIAAQGCSIIPPYTLAVNSFSWFNGVHTVQAIAYDALGNTLSTSPAVSFSTQNTWPVSYGPTLSVSPGTPFSSNWSGNVNVTLTLGGSGSSHDHIYTCFIDGYNIWSSTISATNSATCPIPTASWSNAAHQVCWNVQDGVGGLSIPGDGTNYPSTGTLYGVNSLGSAYAGQHAEGCATVTFSNTGGSKGAYFVNAGYREIPVTPNSTYQLPACTGVYTDGSTTAPTCQYFSSDTTSCTVSSGGLVTIPASPANYNCIIYTLWPATSASYSYSSSTGNINGTGGYSFSDANLNNIVYISTSSGTLPTGSWRYLDNGGISLNDTASPPIVAFGTGYTNSTGIMLVGPARMTWMLISPSNVLAHFGNDGLIHTSYSAGVSQFINWLLASFESPWQPYNTYGTFEPYYSPGVFADIQNSGFNAFDVGYTNGHVTCWPGGLSGCSGSGSQANFNSSAATMVTANVSNLSNAGGCSKCGFRLRYVITGTGNGSDMWIGTYATSASWSPSYYAKLNSLWMATGKAWTAQGNDEFGLTAYPLGGQWKPGVNGLTAVTSNGSGGCATTGTAGPWGFTTGANLISGSTTGSQPSGLNSTNGNYYSSGTVPFSFACGSSVPSGTYNSSTDPGLTLEQFANTWLSDGTINDFVHWDVFAKFRNAWTSVTHPPISFPPAAFPSAVAMANLSGNGTSASGSTTIEGVSQVADFCELYAGSAFIPTPMLAQRIGTPSLVIGALGQPLADVFRGYFYGSPGKYCNPELPRATLVSVSEANNYGYGFESNDTDTVVSLVGRTLTLANPHPELMQVQRSIARLSINGSSDPNANSEFYIDSALSPTQFLVSYAGTTFLSSANCNQSFNGCVSLPNGTIAFADGYTTNISTTSGQGFQAEGLPACGGRFCGNSSDCFGGVCGSFINLASNDTNVLKRRCQTFTVSGSSLSAANGPTFLYPCESSSTQLPYTGIYYRQVPTITNCSSPSNCGTAQINPTGGYWRGINGSAGFDRHPGSIADTYWIGVMEGVSETGFYQYETSSNGYMQDGTLPGGVGGGADHTNSIAFSQNDNGVNWQHGMNAHFENGFGVPTFHALSLAAMLVQAKSKYILQPHLNSPDCGSLTIECAAMGGSYGDALMGVNLAQANQAVTLNYSPYLASGQQVVRFRVSGTRILMTVLTAGTTTDTFTLAPDEKFLVIFPINFSAELIQPVVSARLADVPNASEIDVRYGYDRYTVDAGVDNVVTCGSMSGPCTIPLDKNIAAANGSNIYYRIIYRNSNGVVLAKSDLQTF